VQPTPLWKYAVRPAAPVFACIVLAALCGACGLTPTQNRTAPAESAGRGAGGCAVGDPARPAAPATEEVIARHAHGVAAIGHRLYIAGGVENRGHAWLDAMERLDTRTGIAERLAPLPTPRAFAAVVACQGRVYVIGGMSEADRDAGRYSATVECLDPERGTWSTCPSMPTPRSRLAAAVLGGRIYAIGGLTGGDRDGCADSAIVEAFDPTAGAWIPMPPMPTPRHAHAAVAARGRIWVLGGFSTARSLGPMPVVESFDPAAGAWRAEKPMRSARAWFVAGAHADTLVALGGASGPEQWPAGAGEWAALPVADLPGRRAAGAVVDGVVWILGGEGAENVTRTRRFDIRRGCWAEERGEAADPGGAAGLTLPADRGGTTWCRVPTGAR